MLEPPCATLAEVSAVGSLLSASELQSPPSPKRIGRYLVVGVLGSSDQAELYLVGQPNLGGELVLKLYPDWAPADRECARPSAARHPDAGSVLPPQPGAHRRCRLA